MKILHTSDWHLGKKLENYSRFEEQIEVLDEICSIANINNIDAVVIAGDLYDTFNPPTEATELFYNTLKRLSNNGQRPVIAIAGNHDSADRIEAPEVIARINGIILIGYPTTKPATFKIENGFSVINSDEGFIEIELNSKDKLRIITSPFANELRLRTYLADKEEKLEQLLQNKWQTIADKYCDNKGVNILLSHILMSSTTECEITEPEEEKPIESISARINSSTIPNQIQYSALGHLHRFQNVNTPEKPIVYSGSPIAYSFSEASQKKYVIIVDLKPETKAILTPIELKKGKMLIRKNCENVDSAIEWLTQTQNILVELHVKCKEYLSHEDIVRIKAVHNGIINIIPELENNDNSNILTPKDSIDLSKSRKDLLAEYFEYKFGFPPNNEMKALFNEILTQES